MAPRAINYKSGSIVYFTGDNSDSVFLLKEGRVNLLYNDIENGSNNTDTIQAGEFFGVKSGLIRFSREETAKTIANCTVIEFSSNEFEALITKNTSIILKMLKVFSNQLRRVGKQVQDIVGRKVSSTPSDDLFQIGNYYLKNKKYHQAITVYTRYLHYYPNGDYIKQAGERKKLSEDCLLSYGEGGGPTPVIDDIIVKGKSDNINPNDVRSAFNYSSEEEKVYYQGISLFNQSKFPEAFVEFKKLLMLGNEEYRVLGSFEIGKCLFYINKFSECIQHYSDFLRKFPNFNKTSEVYYFIGLSYQKIGNKLNALDFYKKVVASSSENEDVNMKAQKALKELM